MWWVYNIWLCLHSMLFFSSYWINFYKGMACKEHKKVLVDLVKNTKYSNWGRIIFFYTQQHTRLCMPLPISISDTNSIFFKSASKGEEKVEAKKKRKRKNIFLWNKITIILKFFSFTFNDLTIRAFIQMYIWFSCTLNCFFIYFKLSEVGDQSVFLFFVFFLTKILPRKWFEDYFELMWIYFNGNCRLKRLDMNLMSTECWNWILWSKIIIFNRQRLNL